MGKNNGFFSEEDILKMKEAEKGTGGGGGGIGCGPASFVIGLLLIIAGLFWASAMQGKTLTPVVTPMMVAETAVSQLATPTLAPTATATPSATSLPTGTATAVPTSTPLPTNTTLPTSTPYPTHTPPATWTPQATFTAQPTHTAQPTWTPFPTATETAVPAETDMPFLAPLAIEAEPPNGSPLPAWLPWLVGGLIVLVLALIGLNAYVAHQMRPPTPVLITPEGVPVDTAPYGRQLPPPAGSPVRETRPAPVQTPVTPVTPPGAPVQNSTQRGQGAPPETIQVSVTDANPNTDEATMRAICDKWHEILKRDGKVSQNAVCEEYLGPKNSGRLAIVRRALKWGRANGLIGNHTQKEVKRDDSTISDPKPTQTTERSRRPILNNRRGRSALN